MEKIATNLHLFTLPRNGGWTHFSWLIVRKGGNALVACADTTPELDVIEKLGGVKYVLLTDNHFAAKWHGETVERFGATLVCHKSDKANAEKKCQTKALTLVDQRLELGDDLLAVHTPGHADGGLCYFWNGHLFTGDFLAHTDKGWAVFCGQAKRKIMKKSLETVGELKVQTLCPGCSQGQPVAHTGLKKGKWSELVARTIAEYAT